MTSSPAARRTSSPSTWSCTDHRTPIRWPRYSLASAAPMKPVANAASFAGAKYSLLGNAKWTDSARDEENIRWARDGFAVLQPHLGSGAYANYLVNEPRERVRQAYGAETYDRLVALKDRYDPANVFRLNQNIEPTAPVL